MPLHRAISFEPGSTVRSECWNESAVGAVYKSGVGTSRESNEAALCVCETGCSFAVRAEARSTVIHDSNWVVVASCVPGYLPVCWLYIDTAVYDMRVRA